MSSRPSVTGWVENLKAGDEEAATRLWERYFDQLVTLARKKLGPGKQRAVDGEDVALSVFDCLCKGAKRGRFDKLSDRDDLWRLLVVITRQKCVDQTRRETRQKRGGGAIRGESVFQPAAGESQQAAGIDQFVPDQANPEMLGILQEEFDRLIQALPTEDLRSVALLKMEGYGNEEIAQKLGCVPRTVVRKLRTIRTLWSSLEKGQVVDPRPKS